MTEHVGPIYEVSLTVDAEFAETIDEWLATHVAAMLEHSGFDDADISILAEKDGRVGRVVRYYVASDDDLDNYLAGPVNAMRQHAIDRFGEHFEATRRVLHNRKRPLAGAAQEVCLNCGANLSGQYCGECGQRAQSRIISVWELLKDALGDVLDVDSRLWQTLILLAVRPGQLTRDYLQGRRARYLPPFRTYLVLSLLFFVVAFFDPREDLGLLFETVNDVAEESEVGDTLQEAVTDQTSTDIESGSNESSTKYYDSARRDSELGIDRVEIQAECDSIDYTPDDLPAWLARRLTRDRAQAICRRMTAEDGEGLNLFLDKLLDYVPVGLFVLLPLMALVLKFLYPLSRRYYVEHLLTVIHFHAFVFLAITTQIIVSRLGALVRIPETAVDIVIAVIAFYIPVYLYKMLRRVYEQGYWLTTLKFVSLCFAYWFGLLGIFFTVAILAAFAA